MLRLCRLFAVFVVGAIAALQATAAAAIDLKPGSAELIAGLTEALASDTEREPYEIYESVQTEWNAAAANDPVLAALNASIRRSLAVGDAYNELGYAIGRLAGVPEREQLLESTGSFLRAVARLYDATPPTTRQLYRLGEDFSRLAQLGITRADLEAAGLGDMLWLYDSALEVFESNPTTDALESEEAEQVNAAVAELTALLAPLGEPPSEEVAFTYVIHLQSGYGLASSVMDYSTMVAVEVPLEAAVMLGERERYYEQLRSEGAFGPPPSKDYFEALWEEIEGAKALFEKAKERAEVLDDPEDVPSERAGLPEQCQAVNCDCDNIGFDIGGQFKKECRKWEDEILQQCIASGGVVSGYCHPTASGPAAFPKD